jgi:hypothetical protein
MDGSLFFKEEIAKRWRDDRSQIATVRENPGSHLTLTYSVGVVHHDRRGGLSGTIMKASVNRTPVSYVASRGEETRLVGQSGAAGKPGE